MIKGLLWISFGFGIGNFICSAYFPQALKDITNELNEHIKPNAGKKN